MLYKFVLKLSMAVALLSLLIFLLAIFVSGELGIFTQEGGRLVYSTSYGIIELFGFLSWFL